MRHCLYIAILLGVCACNQPAKQEGVVQTVSTDSFSAKLDTFFSRTRAASIPKVDTTLLYQDSIQTDNAINKDTGVLAPSVGVDIKGVQPSQVMSFAETLIGTPYVYGSTNPKVGFDCSGFITHVFNRFGIQVPRSSVDFTNVGKTIPVEGAKRGDIILFTGTNPLERHVGHMGLIVSNSDTLRFIHSTSGKAMGVTITPLSKYYLSRFVKVIRIFPQNDR